jgi:hypothetical protein
MVWDEKKWLEERGAGCRGGRGVEVGGERGGGMVW